MVFSNMYETASKDQRIVVVRDTGDLQNMCNELSRLVQMGYTIVAGWGVPTANNNSEHRVLLQYRGK